MKRVKRITVIGCIITNSVFSQIAPGGVNSNLHLWIDANKGVTETVSNVSSVTNQVSTPMTTQASKVATSNVILMPGNINYNSTLFFDGTSEQKLEGQYATAPANPALMFAVVKNTSNTVSCCSNPYSQVPGGSPGIGFETQATNAYCVDGSGFGCSSSENKSNKLGIVRVDYASTTSSTNAFSAFNGIVRPSCGAGSIVTPNGGFQIGGRTAAGPISLSQPTRVFRGKIAEVIHYDSDNITNTQVSQIESYLAIKYGITLSTNYLNSIGSVVYNVSSHNNDIIGTSRDDNSSLLQKQSHQEDDSTRIYLSNLTTTNSTNAGSFSSDNQSLIMGHDNGLLAPSSSTEYPSGMSIFTRIGREWKIVNTAFNGNFSIDFKLSTAPTNPSNIKILVDADGDFNDATMLSATISYSNQVVTVSGITTTDIPINSTRFIAIVELSGVSLPIELVQFSAKKLPLSKVELYWQTASEINNDYFTIERSNNGINWSEIKRIAGSGNSTHPTNYAVIDDQPYKTSYYKLKQTDFDGLSTYSQVRIINFENFEAPIVEVFPNPTKNEIILTGSILELEQVKLYNSLGQEIIVLNNTEPKLRIDLSTLNNGIYYLKTKTTVNKIYRE